VIACASEPHVERSVRPDDAQERGLRGRRSGVVRSDPSIRRVGAGHCHGGSPGMGTRLPARLVRWG
jgi:hypothetical protein